MRGLDPGLDPRIHRKNLLFVKAMDCRVKPGNDEGESTSTTVGIISISSILALASGPPARRRSSP
jgi:hypothetical protein